jgi:2-methylcitrate dehydratase PrpD
MRRWRSPPAANFGTDTKPLHVGFAAAAAVRAVLLARAGANASDDVWGPAGFFHAFNGGVPLEPLPWQPGMDWAVIVPGFEHKRFPSCYLTHRLIAGVLKLRERRSAAERASPVRIAIEVPKNGLSALKHPQPATGLQAKFSGHYCAAAAWIDGKVELASFADDAIPRPGVQAQMQRTILAERGTAGESLESAPVHVTLHGEGWTDTITVDWAPGSPADPMSRDQLRGKWLDCASQGGMNPDEALVLRLLDAPLRTPASDLLRPLRQSLLSAMHNPKP